MSADNVMTEAPSAGGERSKPTVSLLGRAKYELIRRFLWGWGRCFSLTGLYWLGKGFGTCEWLINFKRRRRFRRNLRAVFGEPKDHIEPATLRWACYHHFVRTRCDKIFYLIFDMLPREKVLKRFKFPGRSWGDEILERGKGAYACASHVGSYHVAVLLMICLGYRVAIVRDRHEGPLRLYVQEKFEATLPESSRTRTFHADTYPRDLYRCLKDGWILATALDVARDRGSHLKTATVTMFGQPREFLTGTMQIALRCQAPIVQTFVESRKNYYFHIHSLGPLVDPDAAADTPEQLQEVMQRYADNIADFLSKHPDHLTRS